MNMLRRWVLAVLVLAVALVSACSSRTGFGDNGDCDYMVLAETSESGTLPDLTFACVASDLSIDFSVRVMFLGPAAEEGGLGNPPSSSTLSQFMLEHYDVTYRNLSTGGTVQGVDVPRSFRRSIQSIFRMDEQTVLELSGFPILMSGAKQEPPLNNPAFYAAPSGTVFEATLTWWGHPIQNDSAWCYGLMRYVFTVAPC